MVAHFLKQLDRHEREQVVRLMSWCIMPTEERGKEEVSGSLRRRVLMILSVSQIWNPSFFSSANP